MADAFYAREPDHVNEKGVKWWLDKSLTGYARREGVGGVPVDAHVFRVQEPDGNETYVITKDGHPVYANNSLEAIGVRLDIMRALAAAADE